MQRVMKQIRERGSSRLLGPPIPRAQLDALEAALGTPLPAEVRVFFERVTAGEPASSGHAGAPPLLDPRVGRTLLGQPSRPFPVAQEQVPALLERSSDGPAPAAAVEPDGLLAVSDHGCAIYDAVVLAGPLAGTVWQVWDSGITPHGDGAPLAFLDWAEAKLGEILAAAPPRVRPTVTELDYLRTDARLTAFPETIHKAKRLRRLVLTSQPVRRLPGWIGELSELRELMAGGCELESVPDSLGDCAALERLSLSNNELRALPASLAQLGRLRSLDAWGNMLEDLPALGELPALEELDVRRNRLTDLAGALPPSLRKLQLSDNLLARLPDRLVATAVSELRLDNLPELDLAASIDVLSQLPALRTLAFYGLHPPPEALARLTGIRTLRVIAAGWTELPRSIAELTGLEVLSLDQNALTDLPGWVFELPSLRALYLFSNPIAPERIDALSAAHPAVEIQR
jgi:hypothetical protein